MDSQLNVQKIKRIIMKKILFVIVLAIGLLPVSAQTEAGKEVWKRFVTVPYLFKLITTDGKVYYTNHAILKTRTDVGVIRYGRKEDLPVNYQKFCPRESYSIYYLKPEVKLKELNNALADIGIKVTTKDTIYYYHDWMKIKKGLPAYVNVDPSYGFRAERRGNVISLGDKWNIPFFRKKVEEGKIKLDQPFPKIPWKE